METIQAPRSQNESEVPSLSALLKDPSVDRVGGPIRVKYTEASNGMKQLGPLSRDDLEDICFKIAPAAAMWEMNNGNSHNCTVGPIGDRHWGLEGAKIVPIRLNIIERYNIDSPARDVALRQNNFKALRATGLSKRLTPSRLTRWRLSDPSHLPTTSYPSDYIVWENPETGKLYARIPKPLEHMDRGACDHCWIHNQEPPEKPVDYIDDWGCSRVMRPGDTAINPFSLCRFHWWYVMSGELLRKSQVHALEILVSKGLRKRWGISHMREFLRSMSQQISTAAESLDDDMAGKRPPSPGLTPGACLNTARSAVLEQLGNLQLSSARGGTVASVDAHQTVPGGRAATATTAVGPSDTKAGDQAWLFEGGASSPAEISTPIQVGSQGWSDLCSEVNGTPTPRKDGFLRSPPKEPRAMRAMRKKAAAQAKAHNPAHGSKRSREYVLLP